ncbi:uncharacterized protein LOC116308632 [Actinia tenebrosa]|uniref:Uncharacterized protein LOC116308632 n=1 Tax=Actinia tenebrosa TaxID=6105 RepID=A0A6P8JBA7_ACTTE|nr:uncharacterized protein LOC116308632 [Actinia tenebrosa]
MPGTGSQQNAETPVKFALIEAVKNHDESEVKRLIAARVDVNEADYQGKTALIHAVQNNVDIEIIKVLVENGDATVNAKDSYNRNSLFYAITKSKDTAEYLFKKTDKLNNSNVSRILKFFLESLCTKRHDSHPTIDEVVPLLEAKGLTSEILASSIVNILLCKSPLLLTSMIDNHRPRNSDHLMFHLHEKRKSLLGALKEACECKFMENYPKKESIKQVLEMIGGDHNRSISDILNSLKEHDPDPNFADSEDNTAFHYAACLPWMKVSTESIKETCLELKSFGVAWNRTNLQDQTPLLICLSGSMEHLKDDDKLTAMKGLVEVCKFLVTGASSLKETTQDGESVFHLVIKLFQQGFEIPEQTIRQGVIDEMMKLLDCFTPLRVNKTVVQQRNDDLNSPLHLWASLALTTPDYTSCVTPEKTFKQLLKVIFDHLLNCGAKNINDRNKKEETALHFCNTWGAVKLLMDVGANTSDKDSSKRPPLLVAASRKTFLRNPPYFYPDFYLDVQRDSDSDVQEEAKFFFATAVDKKLDPWKVDKFDKSVLGFLIEYQTYDLSKALVEVACLVEENSQDTSERILVSLLNAICKDESLHTRWKVELAKTVLSCAKEKKINVVNEPFDFCCKTMISLLVAMEENQQPAFNDETSIHCCVAQLLRSHGAELSGESYETLRAICPEIDQILENTPVQELVPWTSTSKEHKNVLHRVARRQECKEIGRTICCQASAGSFGNTDLFVGINITSGKEVAIKRIKKTQCKPNLKKLYAQLDCEQVIRYFLHLDEIDHVYFVFELMEGNLDAYLDVDALVKLDERTSLCGDIVKGLKYLHEHEIPHFHDHLKPTSIFYKTHPKLCLKITDFDHSQPADGTSNTYVWSSPEVLKKLENPSEFSDMFSCGLLLHYILSKGKHPFCPDSSTSTSHIVSKTELNIKDNNSKVEDSLSPEGTHLVKNMLGDKVDRKSAAEALDHPLFWPKTKKVDLLTAVGNQPEFEYPRAGRLVVLSAVETELEARFGTIVKHVEWNDPGNVHMPDIYKEMGKMRKKRKYDTHSVVELVRFIRNAKAHVSESTRPTSIRKLLLEDFVFLEYFPNLVMEVYKAVTTHGWDQTREEIKYALKK